MQSAALAFAEVFEADAEVAHERRHRVSTTVRVGCTEVEGVFEADQTPETEGARFNGGVADQLGRDRLEQERRSLARSVSARMGSSRAKRVSQKVDGERSGGHRSVMIRLSYEQEEEQRADLTEKRKWKRCLTPD